jgi:hypothetical protein
LTRDKLLAILKEFIGRKVETKEQVVAILVQIRKVLEFDQTLRQMTYGNIALVCDWVAHSHLSGAGAQRLFQTMDTLLTSIPTNREEELQRHDMTRCFTFIDFRRDFMKLLEDLRL